MRIRKNITKGVTFNSGKKQSSFTIGGKGLSFKIPITKLKKLSNESSDMPSKIMGWAFTIIGGSFIFLMIYVQIEKFFKVPARYGVSIALSHVKLHNKIKRKHKKIHRAVKDNIAPLDTIKN